MKKRFTIMQDSSVIYVLCLLFLSGCHQQISTSISSVEPATKMETSDNRLNILWIVAEDLSHYLPT
jgi:PBP1b-binding outer membrane lipoprotein LpoB